MSDKISPLTPADAITITVDENVPPPSDQSRGWYWLSPRDVIVHPDALDALQKRLPQEESENV